MKEKDNVCKKCGKEVSGYKCEMCGVETPKRDQDHACGGLYCMPKCAGCRQPETKCTCNE